MNKTIITNHYTVKYNAFDNMSDYIEISVDNYFSELKEYVSSSDNEIYVEYDEETGNYYVIADDSKSEIVFYTNINNETDIIDKKPNDSYSKEIYRKLNNLVTLSQEKKRFKEIDSKGYFSNEDEALSYINYLEKTKSGSTDQLDGAREYLMNNAKGSEKSEEYFQSRVNDFEYYRNREIKGLVKIVLCFIILPLSLMFPVNSILENLNQSFFEYTDDIFLVWTVMEVGLFITTLVGGFLAYDKIPFVYRYIKSTEDVKDELEKVKERAKDYSKELSNNISYNEKSTHEKNKSSVDPIENRLNSLGHAGYEYNLSNKEDIYKKANEHVNNYKTRKQNIEDGLSKDDNLSKLYADYIEIVRSFAEEINESIRKNTSVELIEMEESNDLSEEELPDLNSHTTEEYSLKR